MYHQILHDTKKRGIDVGDVKLNLKQMMAAKNTSVDGLTKGVEFLFKKNKVDYIKGTGAFSGENEVTVNLVDGGEQTLRGKNIFIATGSEATPFPGLTIDEKKVITSTGAIALESVPKKMVVIGGGIIGLEMVFRGCMPNASSHANAEDLGFSLVKTGIRSHSRRIPGSNWGSRHGRRDLKNNQEDIGKARHEIQAWHESHERRFQRRRCEAGSRGRKRRKS